MTKLIGLLCIGTAMLLTVANAQNESVAPRNTTAPVKVQEFVNRGWSEDEMLVSKAVFIRAAQLEGKTGFQFEKNWTPTVSLEWSLGGDASGFNGQYKAETETMYFPIRVIYELAARHKLSPGALSAEVAAADDEFAELVDHELGHVLMDQVSRRVGLGPWFTEARFAASTEGERTGLDILSEGTAVYFQNINFLRDYSDLSEAIFPPTLQDLKFYTYRTIAYDGGYWLVRDVLNKYGEQGLIWLMRHPFVAGYNMRAAALAYRDRACTELSKKGL